MLRLLKFPIFLLFLFMGVVNATCPVIPMPKQAVKQNGSLNFSSIDKITINQDELQPLANYLQNQILGTIHQPLLLNRMANAKYAINLELLANSKKIGYSLIINQNKITISASTTEHIFYGINSLLQLVKLSNKGKIDCWEINDAPTMQWRGLMLDEARHFFGKETIKQLLDWMAFYKLNRFHWHLTDRQGWRVEIKKYPKLTLIGGIGNHTDSLATASFYTQKDISEIVQYAKERYIEIIPEIDMPGHATAANRAYPKYSADGPDNPPGFTFNPGMEETYSYLTQILKEISVLFPSKMIHMGGDEVHFGNKNWLKNNAVKQLMQKENLKDVKEVESYFNRRMADSILNIGAKVLGWDEIAGANISNKEDEAIIFWWRADQKEALRQSLQNGYKVVLCPNIPLYLDYNQDMSHIAGRRSGQVANSTEAIYNFSLDQYGDFITKKNLDLVLGMQANIWTERIRSTDRLQYVLFPRMAALAETSWNGDNKDYATFKTRVAKHLELYQQLGLKFYNLFSPNHTPEVVDLLPKVKLN